MGPTTSGLLRHVGLYLNTMGVPAFIPDPLAPSRHYTFVPHIYTAHELERIFSEADRAIPHHKPTDFGYHLSRYFTQHLPGRLGLSPNTIRSYRDAFTAYLEFCRDVDHLAPERLTLNMLTMDRVAAFLDWLEDRRSDSIATRNDWQLSGP